MSKDLLLSPEEFLKSGIHIGTRYKTKGMKRYIYNVRKDGLKVLAIETISDRIKHAAKILAEYEPQDIVIVGRRSFASTPIKKFCDATGMKCIVGRFIPGTFTNTTEEDFYEPKIIFITESNIDKQAIMEAKELNIPVIGFSSTNNFTENIDFVIPANNKGSKSLATLFWLLAREYQLVKGIIKTRQDFKTKVDDYVSKIKEKRQPQQMQRGRGRFGARRFGFRGNTNRYDDHDDDRPKRRNIY